ncbi:MAG: hypothetical protein M3Q13_08930 [Pseudomonadota bacterium]|nr:hypothetical protein [Pseudomonadota bacterium]
MHLHRTHPLLLASLLLGGLVVLTFAGCEREALTPLRGGATKPAQAVALLTRHLHHNDLVAFARDAVPPDLHQRLEAGWAEGRTRWPLTEMPFHERLPRLLLSLSAEGSEERLQAVFDRQFSGATTELKAAAASLGLFGAQYIRNEGGFSADERQHYGQFVQAISRWGVSAPLGDADRARRAIPQLAAAARKTGLRSEADFQQTGMQDSLRRLGPFVASVKQVLAGYGLKLDDSLGGLEAGLVEQDGDKARVRLRYTLGGSRIDTVVSVERHGNRWYLSDYLRHAEASLQGPVAAPLQ